MYLKSGKISHVARSLATSKVSFNMDYTFSPGKATFLHISLIPTNISRRTAMCEQGLETLLLTSLYQCMSQSAVAPEMKKWLQEALESKVSRNKAEVYHSPVDSLWRSHLSSSGQYFIASRGFTKHLSVSNHDLCYNFQSRQSKLQQCHSILGCGKIQPPLIKIVQAPPFFFTGKS